MCRYTKMYTLRVILGRTNPRNSNNDSIRFQRRILFLRIIYTLVYYLIGRLVYNCSLGTEQ